MPVGATAGGNGGTSGNGGGNGATKGNGNGARTWSMGAADRDGPEGSSPS